MRGATWRSGDRVNTWWCSKFLETLSAEQDRQLDFAFVELIDALAGTEAAPQEMRLSKASTELLTLVRTILPEDKLRESAKGGANRRVMTYAAIALCGLLAWPAWSMFRDHQLDVDVNQVHRILKEHPRLLHLSNPGCTSIRFGRIEVTGLIPSDLDVTLLYGELSAVSDRALNLRLSRVLVAKKTNR